MFFFRGIYQLKATRPIPDWILQIRQNEKQMLLILFQLSQEFMRSSKPRNILIAQLSCCLWKFNFYYDLADNPKVIGQIAVRISKAKKISEIRQIVEEFVSLYPGPF